MEMLKDLNLEIERILDEAERIPHTEDTRDKRRELAKKLNDLFDKCHGEVTGTAKDTIDILGEDVCWDDDEAKDYYGGVEGVLEDVERVSYSLDMLVSNARFIREAVEQLNFSYSLDKRLDRAIELMEIASDFLKNTTTE